MKQDQQIRKLLKSLNTYSKIDELSLTDHLFEKGVLDSLMLIQFVLLIEDEFQFKLPNAEMTYENFTTIEKIENLLNRLQVKKSESY